jgi:hypothetical protein
VQQAEDGGQTMTAAEIEHGFRRHHLWLSLQVQNQVRGTLPELESGEKRSKFQADQNKTNDINISVKSHDTWIAEV